MGLFQLEDNLFGYRQLKADTPNMPLARTFQRHCCVSQLCIQRPESVSLLN
jgi:hypothetical protein